jgi:DNA methyltransferase 1-associated protein 1
LYGDRPPPVNIIDSSKAYRKRFERGFKVSRWEHVQFHNDARSDGLLLSHWRKKTGPPSKPRTAIPPENPENPDVVEVESHAAEIAKTPYAFAKYNIEITVPTYTDDQYERDMQNPNWTREETDYLMSLVKDYSQKWAVIVDRYDWQPAQAQNSSQDSTSAGLPQPGPGRSVRDMEALKARFYFISAKAMEYSFVNGIADMNTNEFALHEQYTKYKPEAERTRKSLAWALCKRNPDDVREEEYLLSELQRIMISATKYETERAELRQRLEIVPTANGPNAQLQMSSASLHQLSQQLIAQDRNRKPRARISIDPNGTLQSPSSAAGMQTPASAGGHRESLGGSGQKKASISQAVPLRQLTARDELRFGVSTPVERIVSGVTFRTDKVLKLRQAKSQIQTQKINQALSLLDIPDLIALPTNRVVQAFESLIQKINLLLDARKVLAKEESELQTALAIKAEIARKKAEEKKAQGEANNADGDDDVDAEGEDVDMIDVDLVIVGSAKVEETRPGSSRSNVSRVKRSASVASITSSKASTKRKK